MTAAKSPRLAPRTGGRVLADALVAQGIDHVFAVPGESYLDVLDGLYGVSKAGLIHMTTVMAKEWGRHGINTNAICPGYIATEISAEWLPTPGGQKLLASLPRKRMGEAQDLDGVLTLLCSGQAGRFINGAVMVVDDGYVAM